MGFTQLAQAEVPFAKLEMRLSGPTHDRDYYLCVSNNGCSNISAAAKGKIYNMDTGDVSYIFAANMRNLKMKNQPLPPSCQVALTNEQTLIVSGRLVVNDASQPYIDKLKCTVK
jgi:hypothetical protein